MQEYFLEYLMGSLDQATHARVDAYLAEHPEARERLALLEQALAPLACDFEPEAPPPGLVLSTLARVAEQRCLLPSAPAPSRRTFAPPSRRGLRLVDWIVAAVVLFLVAGLAFPFVLGQWREYHRLACSNNLRQFFVGLSAYGDRNDGEFPRVEMTGARSVAGIFVPLLSDAGVLGNVSIDCPAQSKRPPLNYRLSQLEKMYDEAPEQYSMVTAQLAGHYAYCLGYKEGGTLRGLRSDSGNDLALLADRPGSGVNNSVNHGGHGQNVLFVGGDVRWCTHPRVGFANDHIYVNQLQQINAGLNRSDSVLGVSNARPGQGE